MKPVLRIGLLSLSVMSSVSHAQILPNPDYSGDIKSRSTLTGDWGGQRNELAKKGFHVELSTVVTYQNLFEGGFDENDNAIGSTDLVLQLDTHKAGLWPGGLFKLRAETRYGNGINKDVGALSPVNNDSLFPIEVDHFSEEVLGITELTFMQFFSEKMGIIVGLLNTLDGDANELAGSMRDNSHFLNASFQYSQLEGATVPSVTLGGGLIFLPNERIVGKLLVMHTEESSLNDPFETDDGITIATEWTLHHKLFALPGRQTFGVLYGFDGKYTTVGNNPRSLITNLVTGQGLPSEDESWAVYYNAHQYVKWENDRGWGLFARAGISDDDTNIIDWNVALGIGGKGVFQSRPNDTFGIGYYHLELAEGPIQKLLDIGNEDGLEAWYNFAVTPWLGITADIQVINTSIGQPLSSLIPILGPGGLLPVATGLSTIPESETAYIAGLRLRIEF